MEKGLPTLERLKEKAYTSELGLAEERTMEKLK